MEDFFFRVIVVIAALIVAFLLLREVMTWYWKQNEIVDLLKEQNRLLRVLIDVTDPDDESRADNDINEDDDFETQKRKKSFLDKVKEAEVELKNKGK